MLTAGIRRSRRGELEQSFVEIFLEQHATPPRELPDTASQSTGTVVLHAGLHAVARAARTRTEGDGTPHRALRHDPHEAAQDRSRGHRHRPQGLGPTRLRLPLPEGLRARLAKPPRLGPAPRLTAAVRIAPATGNPRAAAARLRNELTARRHDATPRVRIHPPPRPSPPPAPETPPITLAVTASRDGRRTPTRDRENLAPIKRPCETCRLVPFPQRGSVIGNFRRTQPFQGRWQSVLSLPG